MNANRIYEKLKNLSAEQLDALNSIYKDFSDEFGDDDNDNLTVLPPMRVINFDMSMPSIIAGFFLASLKWNVSEDLVNNRIDHKVMDNTKDETIIALDNGFLVELMGLLYGLTFTYAIDQKNMAENEFKLLILDTVKKMQLDTYDNIMNHIDRFLTIIKAKDIPGYDTHLQKIMYKLIFLNYNSIDDFKRMGIDAYNEGINKSKNNKEEDNKNE
jgi:hypothetical protein